MDEKKLSILMRIAIILVGICGVLVCLFWVPMRVGGRLLDMLSWSEVKTAEFWVQYAFQWLISLPCFWLLIMAWKITAEMRVGRLFVAKNAIRVTRATRILMVDVLLFLLGNIVFTLLGWNQWLVCYIFASIVGLILTIFLFIFSKYLMQAAALQEECDLTV